MRSTQHVAQTLIIVSIAVAAVTGTAAATKQVECSVELVPNYVWHVFALSNIGDREVSEYKEMYGHTMRAADAELIHRHRELIAWGNGRSGRLTGVLFFVPLSNAMAPPEFLEYLDDLHDAAATSSWETFLDRYDGSGNERDQLALSSGDVAVLAEVCRIFKANLPRYEKEVWPETRSILQREKSRIDKAFAERDVIGRWEAELGMELPGPGFVPVLTLANAIDHLPSANNLSLSRNNIGVSGQGTEHVIDLIVHEIGIFTLMPVIIELFEDPQLQSPIVQQHNVVYQAVESFIEWTKGRIEGTPRVWEGEIFGGGHFDFRWFFEYFERETAKGIAVPELLRSAVESYAARLRSSEAAS